MQSMLSAIFYCKLPIFESISIITDNNFLPIMIELENGTQFTTKICDSKGYADDGEGKYHNFGGSGKCIVEFIYDDYNLPSCVAFSGSWGYYNWNGLGLGANIKSIKKINYGDLVVY